MIIQWVHISQGVFYVEESLRTNVESTGVSVLYSLGGLIRTTAKATVAVSFVLTLSVELHTPAGSVSEKWDLNLSNQTLL